MIGPSLPGQTSEPGKEDANGPSTSRRMMGPMLPDNNQETESSERTSSAAKEFIERQERIRIASEHDNGSASRTNKQPEQRPDWMLAPPSASGISDMFKQDPSAALKSRGFNQSGNMRVQRTATVPTNPDEIDSASWTETPQDRAKRLYEEQMGIREVNGTKSSHLQSQQLEDERKREERIRQAIQEHQASRGPSLLEQHQAKRRKDLRSKEHRSDRDDRHRRHHSRRSKGSDDEENRSSRHHRHRRERSQSVSDDGQKHSRSRDIHSEDGKSKRHNEDRHRSRHHSSHSSSRRTHRSRSRSPSKERDSDRSRAQKREEKEIKREKERKKRRKEEEEREEKRGAPTMIWDREAALSVGGQLMDERKRSDFIKSSATLSDRFGQGSSKYM